MRQEWTGILHVPIILPFTIIMIVAQGMLSLLCSTGRYFCESCRCLLLHYLDITDAHSTGQINCPKYVISCLVIFRYLLLTFSIFNLFYSSFSLILTILFYRFYEAHVAYMVIVMVIVTWNGASFYTDVFAVKGFKPQL